jgi:hypothetical protein
MDSRIEDLRDRLGTGDITLATINLKLEQILAQTIKTNGRVTELERKAAIPRMNWPIAGAVVGSISVICGAIIAALKV